MGEEIKIEKIVCHSNMYQIDIRHMESGIGDRIFIRKDELFTLIAAAEKEDWEGIAK
jgi:hypothetical protein